MPFGIGKSSRLAVSRLVYDGNEDDLISCVTMAISIGKIQSSWQSSLVHLLLNLSKICLLIFFASLVGSL